MPRHILILLSTLVLLACHQSPDGAESGEGGEDSAKSDDSPRVERNRIQQARAFWHVGRSVRHRLSNHSRSGQRVAAHSEITILGATDTDVVWMQRDWAHGFESKAREERLQNSWQAFLAQREAVMVRVEDKDSGVEIPFQSAAGQLDGVRYQIPSERGPSGELILLKDAPGVVLFAKLPDTRVRGVAWKVTQLESLE